MPDRYWKKLVLTCCVFLGSFNLEAGPGLQHKNWEIGPEIFHQTYEEPGVMKEEGVMYGLQGAVEFHDFMPGPVHMLRVEGTYAWGEQDYTSGRTGDIDDIEVSFFEVRGILGHDVHFQNGVVTPYVGFGYRWKEDRAGEMVSTTGALGYDRESNYSYSPIGIAFEADLEKGWSIGGWIEYDLFWDGTQRSCFSELHPLNSDLVNDQNEGYGLRASLRVTRELDETFLLAVEPFWRYWDIEQSEPGDFDEYNPFLGKVVRRTGYEPANSSTEYGVKIVLFF
ncbi:hypothetical protein OO006_11370 [Prosthecochloris sp. SCSIO W1101]|uniref:outer membrane beta-barrel protein n=1 Tax=Prosthecochloris sp. SCSIO W1101 TaxID=2992242 RepID=UPI00223D0FAC|nr:hypothetical protein [Prosthecochloris sp. SCSIO W1101]UZJ40941.1 hypothetical protein OO006_11370 [Prosthecochloris sp. SCSIO W1101]